MADGLLHTLRQLIDHGSVAWSAVSATQRKELRPLLATGVLMQERSGGGQRLVVANASVLKRFARQRYPSGIAEAAEAARNAHALSPAAGVHHFRDAKRGVQSADMLLLRGQPASTLTCGGTPIPVGDLTAIAGATAVVLEADRAVSMTGTLAIVENQTAFLRAHALGVPFDVALYGSGRLSKRVLTWLGSPSMQEVAIVHCPDYDPVGLSEYSRLHACCGDRVRLHCPANIEHFIQTYGKPSLYQKNIGQLPAAQDLPADGAHVAALLERYGCGLEQEILVMNTEKGGRK